MAKNLKVACLTATMSMVQRDLGNYGLYMDVNAFWAQFAQKYNAVTASLRHAHGYGQVTPDHLMDPASEELYDELVQWLDKIVRG